MSALTGLKIWDTGLSQSLSPGRYWLAHGVSSTQTTQQTANLSGARSTHSHIGMSQPNVTIGAFGAANPASLQIQQGIGSYSSNGTVQAIGPVADQFIGISSDALYPNL
jgi:hypothetical protein